MKTPSPSSAPQGLCQPPTFCRAMTGESKTLCVCLRFILKSLNEICWGKSMKRNSGNECIMMIVFFPEHSSLRTAETDLRNSASVLG